MTARPLTPVELSRLLPTDKDLPCDDGEPMDTPWHRSQMNLLIDVVEHHWRDRRDFYCGGNMFMYFSPERVFTKDFRGPDFFLVTGVDRDRDRRSWVAWQEQKLPDLIVELASESTIDIDRTEKRDLYGGKFGTAEYFVYDPATETLERWHRPPRESRYAEPPARLSPGGRLRSDTLGLDFGLWDGAYTDPYQRRYLRLFTPDGRLVPTHTEAAQAAAAAAQAEADAAKAELARLRAELDRLRGRTPPTTP